MERLLLKISGEALGNSPAVDFVKIRDIAEKIAELSKQYSIAIVVGAGNIFRGKNGLEGFDDLSDELGLDSTNINAKALKIGLKAQNINVVAMTSFFPINHVKKYDVDAANCELKNNFVVILGGGTGHVGCTTDTAAAEKAVELGCKYLIKLSNNIDGLYDDDPNKNKEAKKYERVTFQEALDKKLEALDEEAFKICMKNNIPIIVINTSELAKIPEILSGKKIGTLIF